MRVDIRAKIDAAEVSDGVWQRAQRMLLIRALPFTSEAEEVVGVGGAVIRMNAAKLTVSAAYAEAGLAGALPLTVMFVASSGVALKTQPGTAERSFMNTSLATPCSTLYASPAKMSNDLFCAFHPKRVTVPSLPIVFSFPWMPRAARCAAVESRFAFNLASRLFSPTPNPTPGV